MHRTSLRVARDRLPVLLLGRDKDDSILSDVSGAIEDSRRNGKTVTLVDAMVCQRATILSDPTTWMSAKTHTISTDDITFEVTLNSDSTEYTNATAIVAQAQPFGMLVAFTEA